MLDEGRAAPNEGPEVVHFASAAPFCPPAVGGSSGPRPLPPRFQAAAKMPSRPRFHVELKLGLTTFVSWKKLMKEFHKADLSTPSEAPVGAHPALEARIAPDVAALQKDPLPPPPNRFNSVIEKIERIYKGGDSSDENENLGDIPDDDQYDTADSFIDDTELDEYFSVDKAKLKHKGFFVNRGKLERESELAASPVAGPKKRRRSEGSIGGRDQGASITRKSHDSKGTPKKRGDSRLDHSTTKQHAAKKIELLNSLKLESVFPPDVKTANLKAKSAQKSFREEEPKETMGAVGKLVTCSPPHGKEISPTRSKGTALERAIQDLEKGVGQACPPLSDKELEQGKRNRLPQDVKQKLAKVARLAEKQGKVSEELIERLMRILGHLMHVKTLKKHLKEMIELGLSAMQEKEGRLQDIKREVTAMVKSRVHLLQAEDMEQREVSSDDFQPSLGLAEKLSSEGRYRWDHATEDKLCDLYEQYIEGMDENKGPQIRKLYAELAELWPDGLMDNVGVKLAVQRAKERKKKQNKVGEESRKRRRPTGKPKMDSSADRVPFLDLNLPGTAEMVAFDPKDECPLRIGSEVHLTSGVKMDPSRKLVAKKFSTTMREGNNKLEGSSLVKKKVKRKLDKSGVVDATVTEKRTFLTPTAAPHNATMFETPHAQLPRDLLLPSTIPRSFLASLEGRQLQVPAVFFGVGWAQSEHPDAWESTSYEGSIVGMNPQNKKLKCIFKGDPNTYLIHWSELKDYVLPPSLPCSYAELEDVFNGALN